MKLKIGSKLLAIRDERRLSQAEMAELLELPTSTYARYERNEAPVELEKLTSFSEKLNVPIQELLPETISINNNSSNWGQGGGVIFGNQYYYMSKDDVSQQLEEQNKALRQNIKILEERIRELSKE